MKEFDHGSDSGFSLVEVLVGLMLTAVLIASLTSLAGQFRTILDSNERVTRTSDLNKVVRKIAEIIEQAEKFPTAQSETNQDFFLVGKPDSISFVATLKTGIASRQFREIQIRNGASQTLILEIRYRRGDLSAASNVEPDKIEFVSGDLDINFRYLDLDAHGGKSTWTESWIQPARLPRAVLVTLSEKQPDGRSIEVYALADLTMD